MMTSTSAYPSPPNSFKSAQGSVTGDPDDTESGGVIPAAEEVQREQWGSRWEFIFSCVGYTVGIGNVWRFPYLAYENGGGAFLFPYLILLMVIGKPLYLMEVALGQFSQLGPIGVWRICPIGRGLGYAMCTLSILISIYYNVIMAYCLFFMAKSLSSEVPWATCNAEWAVNESCYVATSNFTNISFAADRYMMSSAEQYWHNYVLGADKANITIHYEPFNATSNLTVEKKYALENFGNIGEIKWDLAVALLISWFIVFLCLSKGIKSIGKVVYVSATVPSVILLVLLVRGVMLDGALDGMKYLFLPQWEKLLDITVWRKAAEQIIFSLSICQGGLIMYGSYNKFNVNVQIYSSAICNLDFIISIISSVVIFSILGELKMKLKVEDIQDVVKQKQGLAFVAYPEAINLLPVPQVWAFLFFCMLFVLGLDSEFAMVGTFLDGIYDTFPATRRCKTWICLLLCCSCFFLSLPCISYSGTFILELMDTYGGGLAVFCLAIFETIAIMWVYGVKRFSDDLHFMLKYKVPWHMKLRWYFIPIILIVIFVVACAIWQNPTFDNGKIYYPQYAHLIGWGLILLVALQVPIFAIVMTAIYAAKGKVKEVWKPKANWGPGDQSVRDSYYRRGERAMMEQEKLDLLAAYYNYAMQHPPE